MFRRPRRAAETAAAEAIGRRGAHVVPDDPAANRIATERPKSMEVTRTQIAAAFIVVIVACALAGGGAAWMVNGGWRTLVGSRTVSDGLATTRPALAASTQPTTRPAVLAPAQAVTLTGKAICGTCFLDMGPTSTHPVVLETTEPYRTFVLADNEQLRQIEVITGSCANGDYEITVIGDVLLVAGRNVLVAESFSHRLVDTAAAAESNEDS